MAEILEDCFGVFLGFHLAKNGFDPAIGSNEEGAAFGAHEFFAIHGLFNPNPVSLDDLVVFIADQRKGQVVLGNEVRMALWRIDADTKDDRPRLKKWFVFVAQRTSLGGATRGVILGVEIEQKRFSFEVREGNLATILISAAHGYRGKIGGFITWNE